MAFTTGSLLLQAVLLCALLAASVRRASAGRALTNYYYSYESTSFKVEWSSLSSCVDYVDYKKCSSYSFTKKVVILQCVMDEKCHKRAPETCCVDGDKEYKHHCYASCFGYNTYTPGKCHQKPPHEEHKKPKKPKHPKKPKQPKKPKKGHYEDMCDLCSGQQPKPGHGHGGKHGKW